METQGRRFEPHVGQIELLFLFLLLHFSTNTDKCNKKNGQWTVFRRLAQLVGHGSLILINKWNPRVVSSSPTLGE